MKAHSPSQSVSRPAGLDVLLSLLIFTVVLLVVTPPDRMLGWDEVDYIQAARQGLLANALDATSLPLSHFIDLALAKTQGLPPPPVPPGYSEAADLFHLRHFHPPLLQYLGSFQALIPASSTRLATIGGFGLRWFCGAALIVCSLFTAQSAFGRPRQALSRCLQGAIVVYAAWLLSIAVQYHVLMAISLVLVALCLGRSLQLADRASHLWLSLALAGSILSLETSLVVVAISFGIYLLLGSLQRGGKLAAKLLSRLQKGALYILLIPYVITFALWPASLAKLSLLRTTGMYAYRLFWVKEEYAAVFTRETAEALLSTLLPLILASLITLLISGRKLLDTRISPSSREAYQNESAIADSSMLAVFTLLGLCYALFMLPFVLNTTYMVPGLLLLALPLPRLLEAPELRYETLLRWEARICFGLLILLLAASVRTLEPFAKSAQYPGWNSIAPLNEMLSQVSSESKPGIESIYADGGHIFRFYLPERVTSIFDISLIRGPSEPGKEAQLFTRKDLQYELLRVAELQKPALLIVRNRSAEALGLLGFKCSPSSVPGLSEAIACLVK